MMITQAVREASTEPEIYLLLTAYVHATCAGDGPDAPLRRLMGPPLSSADDLKRQIERLFAALGKASKRLDDDSRVIIKEALYVFGEAFTRIGCLNRAASIEAIGLRARACVAFVSEEVPASRPVESIPGCDSMEAS